VTSSSQSSPLLWEFIEDEPKSKLDRAIEEQEKGKAARRRRLEFEQGKVTLERVEILKRATWIGIAGLFGLFFFVHLFWIKDWIPK